MIDIAKLREIKRTNAIQKKIEEDNTLMSNAIIQRTNEFEKLIDDSLLAAANNNKTSVDIKFNIISLENLKAFLNIISLYQNDYRCIPVHVNEYIEKTFDYETFLHKRALYFMYEFAKNLFEYKNIEYLIELFKDKNKFINAYKSYTKIAVDYIIIRFDFAERN